MNAAVSSYAAVLLTLDGVGEAVRSAKAAFNACPALSEALSNPTIPEAQKFSVIERVLPQELWNFFKVVCRNGQIDSISDIMTEYETLLRRQNQCVHAVVEYVTPLTDAQVSAMKNMICAKTGKPEVLLEMKQNPALVGGFVLHIGDETYDRSVRSAVQHMRKSMIRR